jgi:hypothetical protein
VQVCVEESLIPTRRKTAPELATHFSKAAEFDLGIDLYEDTPISNFISKLLDMVHKLQVQLHFADQDIARLQSTTTNLEAEGGAPKDELTRSPPR